MKRITARCLLLLLILTVGLGCLSGCAKRETELEDILGPQAAFGEALYADSFESFSEMEQQYAKLIVRGKVISTEPGSELNLSQKAVVSVTDVYKGRDLDELTVVQLYDRELKEGNEYLLFLTPQYPDDPDSCVYTTVSGHDGQILIDSAHSRLVLGCDKLMDDGLTKWIGDNAAELSEYKLELSGGA